MIRFSAVLVAVAIGILVAGMVASSLLLVYVAIGLSVVALLTLVFGVALKREEIFGQQGHPGPAVPGGQDVLREPFGQQAVAFGQAAWAAAPDTRPGTVSPQRTGASASWQSPASPAPQQTVAQTRVDTALTPADVPQIRADAAQARADAAQARADLGKTRTDLTETKADLTETKADTASGQSAALNWFQRIAPARSADDDVKAENTDAADSPASDAPAEAKDAIVEANTTKDKEKEEAEAADAAADTAAADTVSADAVAEDTAAEDTDNAGDTDDAGDTDEPSAAGSDVEAEAEDNTPADAADNSPDGDQESRSGQREVTVVPGVPRYHDAKCILIRFMGDDDLQKMPLDEATEAGCTPCKACIPEQA